jgi:Tol biopolymer transport system component
VPGPKCGGRWEPAWSPDGKKLAIATSYGFHPGAPSDRFGIGIIDVATGKVKAVVDHDFRPDKTASPLVAGWTQARVLA